MLETVLVNLKDLSITLHSCYIDQALVHANHNCAQTRGMCPPPISRLGGMLPDTSSPISSRDAAGMEAAHLEERITAALDCSKRRAKAESDGRRKL